MNTRIEYLPFKPVAKKIKNPGSQMSPGSPFFIPFDNLHFLIEKKGEKITAVLVEDPSALQKQILSILQLPEIIYSLSFDRGKKD